MQLKDMLTLERNQLIEWIIDNEHDYVIVPKQLNIEMRKAYHNSIDDIEDGVQNLGCPDDQWLAMLSAIESQETN